MPQGCEGMRGGSGVPGISLFKKVGQSVSSLFLLTGFNYLIFSASSVNSFQEIIFIFLILFDSLPV